MATANFEASRIKMIAEVGVENQFLAPVSVHEDTLVPYSSTVTYAFDVVSFQSHFALNTIPTAIITCAVGRDVYQNLPSSFHLLNNDPTPGRTNYMPLIVRAMIIPTIATTPAHNLYGSSWYPINRWFHVFQGYVTGVSIETTSGGYRAVLQCVHFCADLAFSSAASRTSVPQNPSSISINPLSRQFPAGNQVMPLGIAYYNGLLPIFDGLDTTNMQKDLWGSGIGLLFKKLCAKDRFGLPAAAIQVVKPVSTMNYEALRALLKVEGFPGGIVYEYGTELQFQPLGKNKDALSAGSITIFKNIVSMLALTSNADSIATSTLWDKLVNEYSSMFMFAIVPMIDRLLVVPFLPNYTYDYTYIPPYEVIGCMSQSMLTRPLRGVGLLTFGTAPVPAMGNAQNPPNSASNNSNVAFIGGYYESNLFPTGQIKIVRSPAWMENVVLNTNTAGKTAGFNAVKGGAAAPNAGKKIDDSVKTKDVITAANSVAENLAKMFFGFELLKDRQFTATLPLRFDIAPGSTVSVGIAEDPYVMLGVLGTGQPIGGAALTPLEAPKDTLDQIFGLVNRVTINIDVSAQTATTTINLSYARNRKENFAMDFTQITHPLYPNVFEGAPLSGALPKKPSVWFRNNPRVKGK